MPTYDGIGETITHKLEIEGDMFLQDIEGGTNSTQVPLEIFSDFETSGPEAINSRMLRLRVQNYGETDVSNSYVTDFGIRGQADKDYFFITAPQNTSNVGDQNTFVISKTSNVGIGTTDPGHYRLLVNNSSTKHFGVPGNDTPTTGDTLVYNESGEWVYHFVEGTLPPGTVNNEILTWNGTNWVPNHSILTSNSNAAIGIGTYVPNETSNGLHVVGSVTATNDVNISGKFQGGKLRVGSLLSAVPTNPNVTVPGDLTVSGTLTSDEWIHTDDVTITGNIGVTGTITTSNIVGGSPLTISTDSSNVIILNSNVGIGTTDPEKPLHVVGDSWITGTLTASNIVGASPVTISSNLVMASGFTLTAGAIEPPTGSESNLKITGTITTSNIVANTGDNLLVSSSLEVGTSNLFVDTTTGRVGIGTDSPVDNFAVFKNTLLSSNVEDSTYAVFGNQYSSGDVLNVVSFGDVRICCDANNNSTGKKISFITNGGTNYDSGTVGGGSELMTILDTGNVGIGTDSPLRKLDVRSGDAVVATNWISGAFGPELSAGDRVVIGNLYGKACIGAHNSGLTGWADLTINSAGGNVGIGTDAPREKLEVYGSAETFEGRTARVQIVDSGRYVDVGHGGYLYIGSREAGHSGGWSYAMFQSGIPGNWTDASGQRRSFNRVILNFRYFNISNANAGTTWRFVVYLTRNGSSIQKAEWYAGDVGNARGYMTTSSPIIDLAWSDVPGLIMYVYDNTYSGWTCRIGSMWLTYVSD